MSDRQTDQLNPSGLQENTTDPYSQNRMVWQDGVGWIPANTRQNPLIAPQSPLGAGLQGKLLSYLYEQAPNMNSLVPGYSPTEPLSQKIPDWMHAGFKLAKDAVLSPLTAFESGVNSAPGSPEQISAATNAALGITGLGMGVGSVLRPPVGSLGMPISVLHGSRHLFPAEPGAPLGRFRNDKINTGEGAQARGWGHYLAEEPGVANSYRTASADPDDVPLPRISYDGEEITPADLLYNDAHEAHPAEFGSGYLVLAQGDLLQAKRYLLQDIKEHRQTLAEPTKWYPEELKYAQDFVDHGMDALEWLHTLDPSKLEYAKPGHLYNVQVNAEPEELLHLDKPLGEQAPELLDKLAGINNLPFMPHGAQATGEQFYKGLSANLGSDQLASEALDAAGVPGLRFLDAHSRHLSPDHPDATHNLVMFHPRHMQIVGRDGKLLQLLPVEENPFPEESGQ